MERLYKRLLMSTREGVCRFVFDDGRMLLANQSFLDLFDLKCSAADVVGRRIAELPISVENAARLRGVLFAPGEIHGLEYHFRTAAGDERWVIYDSYFASDPVTGQRLVDVILKDITPWKQAEESARAEQGRIQEYVDVVRTIIVVIRADERLALINREGCRMLEYERDEILGRNWFDTCIPADIRAEVRRTFRRLIQGEIEPVEYFENPIVTRRGARRLIAWHNAVLRDGSGRIVETLSSGEDITDRRQTEQELTHYREGLEEMVTQRTAQLRAAKDSLEQEVQERKRVEESLRQYQEHLEERVAARTTDLTLANAQLCREIQERKEVEKNLRAAIHRLEEHDRAQRDFVSNVSHELKTPVASMAYCLENLLGGIVGAFPERVRTYLLMMKEDCERLTGTIHDILDLSHLEMNKLVLHRVRVPFARFARHAVESLRVQAEVKNQTLTVHADDQAGFVECDPRKMERVILNIVQNAVNYTPAGGAIEVYVRRAARPPAAAVLQVVDNGVGIPPEAIDRITERYFRVGEQVTGTGLGLSLCKEILRLHGGGLDFKSPPPGRSRGTQVTVTLPAAEAATVLVMDDDVPVLEAMRKLLEQIGYRVVACSDSRQGLDALERGRVDLAIVDVLMPGLSGLEIIAQAKANRNLRDLPVIMMTGTDMDPTRRELLRTLNIPVLTKPWREEDLLDCVDQELTGRPAPRS